MATVLRCRGLPPQLRDNLGQTLATNQLHRIIMNTPNGDNAVETDEIFRLVLSTSPPGYAVSTGHTTILTDDVGISVGNDSSTDKVFKYTMNGSLLGSWTISTPGATSPTGITLDPVNANHLWTVDSGTRRFYQYDAAADRIDGSQSASMNFSLTSGNNNPQGIA